ncbi:10269_t:CDS:1 [Scutellospora calospora]|uniref:10269_t:CDS:1 n=1 Tax=Scutellospora calospora TaxID=85575 RepID=A0ACA9K110_9GLOM|nr:10269_t:CDS:1 [Scutellospora calospora]
MSWKDPLCIFSILSLIALNAIYWVGVIIDWTQMKAQPDLVILIFQAIFWMLCGICSFIYTFTPILTIHFNHVGLKVRFDSEIPDDINCQKEQNVIPFVQQSNENSKENYSINSRNATVGSWYMITVGFLTLGYGIFYVIIFITPSFVPYHPITNSVDFLLRAIYLVIYGIPPTKIVLKWVTRNVLGIKDLGSIKMTEMHSSDNVA